MVNTTQSDFSLGSQYIQAIVIILLFAINAVFTTLIYNTYILFDNSVPIKLVTYQFDQYAYPISH